MFEARGLPFVLLDIVCLILGKFCLNTFLTSRLNITVAVKLLHFQGYILCELSYLLSREREWLCCSSMQSVPRGPPNRLK